jgi:hypothetical protein
MQNGIDQLEEEKSQKHLATPHLAIASVRLH